MPLLVQSDSDGDTDMEAPDVRQPVEQATPPNGPRRHFTSKADLMSGVMDDDIPDYDFMDDSNDSDLEIYGQIEGVKPVPKVYSIADTDEREGYHEESEAVRNTGQHFYEDTLKDQDDKGVPQDTVAETDVYSRGLGSPLDLAKQTEASSSVDVLNRKEGVADGEHSERQQNIDERWTAPPSRDDQSRLLPRRFSSVPVSSNQSEHMAEIAGDGENDSDIDMYIKAEEGDSLSDSESIHHDYGSGGASSTIHTTPSLDRAGASEVTPNVQQPQPITDAQHLIPEVIEAPQEIQALLNEYWDVHGRELPPCGTFTHPKTLNHGTPGRATWLHISGDILEASLYRLSGIPTDYKNLDKRIIVVKGQRVGPFVVTYHCIGGGSKAIGIRGVTGSGSRYRIWQGLKGETPDGFEAKTSVWKGYPNVAALTKLKASEIECLFEGPGGRPFQKSLTTSTAQQQSSTRPQIGPLSPSVPESLRALLEAWFAQHGRGPPPCAGLVVEQNLHKNASGRAAVWWHKSGVRLNPNVCALGESTDPHKARLTVVEGEGVSPLIVRYWHGSSKQAIFYRVWAGIEGDEQGFEEGCSVFKVFNGRTPTLEELQRWEASAFKASMATSALRKKPVPLAPAVKAQRPYSYKFKGNGHVDRTGVFRKPSQSLRPRNSISAPEKFSPSAAAGSKYTPSDCRLIGKRKRNEEAEDAESLLSSFLSPAAEKRSAELKATPSELAEHVNNNVVLLFYPKDDGPPRVRLLGSCDSVQKLFAQALAGDVFGDGGGSGTRVLALTFGGGRQKSRSLVDDDDQDYDDLVTALRGLDCWFVEDGALQGSLTVEVRVK